MTSAMIIRQFSELQPYETIFSRMREFSLNRVHQNVHDEIWCLEHLPVYTQGQAGQAKHVLCPGSIPVVQSDRGGQITYHGPGQLMVYFLLTLEHYGLKVRALVNQLEHLTIALLNRYSIPAYAKPKAPGLYVHEKKICSLGLRIRKGFCYHGLSLNICMDLSPFERINPCGYEGLKMTQISDFLPDIPLEQVQSDLIALIPEYFKGDTDLTLIHEVDTQ